MEFCAVGKLSLSQEQCSRSTGDYELLGNLTLSIQGHLKRLKITGEIESEGRLIAVRLGIFDEQSKWGNLTVCSHHRKLLGVQWAPKERHTCQYPMHQGKGKPERSITLKNSKDIQKLYGKILQVGTGICQTCRKRHTEKMQAPECSFQENSAKRTFSLVHKTGEFQQDQIQECCMEESSPGSAFGSLPITEDYQQDQIQDGAVYHGTQSSITSIYTSDGSEVWEPSQSSTTSSTVDSIHILNEAIEHMSSGNISPIKSTLRTDLETAGRTTRWYYKRKAEESIEALLETIAPGQGLELLKLTKFFKGSDNEYCEDENSLTNLASIYENAETWQTKRQILSIMTDKASKQELMNIIPGLTKWRIDEARKHSKEKGSGMPVGDKKLTRERLCPLKIDHFMEFISQPHYLQDVAYGTKTIKLSTGVILTIPNVVRTVIHTRLIDTYTKLCSEINYLPLSERTLFRILNLCAASKRKNLAGLDSVMQAGTDAFLKLEEIRVQLGDVFVDNTGKDDIQDSKKYIKGDFKTHLEMSDNCSFHCITFALSDPKEKSYRSQCHHNHQDNCDRCSKLETIFSKLEEKINSVIDADLQEELKHDLSQSKINIHNWKNHIIRSANQNKAKTNIISTLSPNQILIFMDWAMKYIPIIDRESQSEWFGKKGLNWHVTAVCIRKSEEEGMKIYCYIHIFDSCTQNWYSVASILEDVLTVVKEKDDTINEAYIRSDNAGCYKSAPLLLSLPGISNRSRINIKRYDFSDAQGGKDICDRRIAPIKQHMKAYANEGHSIKTANQMKKAIESYGGIAGTFTCVVKINQEKQTLHKWKWPGISELSNFEWYDDGSLKVWKQYDIGPGKLITATDVQKMLFRKSQNETELVVIEPFIAECKAFKDTSSSVRVNNPVKYYCSEPNCISFFSTNLQLEEHLDVGCHSYTLEHETTYDKITKKWGQLCTSVQLSNIPNNSNTGNTECNENIVSSLQTGWALRQQRKSARFSIKLKQHLNRLYDSGNRSGDRADPCKVAESLKKMKDAEGKKVFDKDEWISAQQIASYFSRCTYQKSVKVQVIETEEDEDLNEIIQQVQEIENERNLTLLRHEVLESLQDN